MIPFGVKVLWFVLSLTGLITSWLVLIPFGRAVGAMWGPLLYCIGNTLLQVIFCLGIIWRMDPFLMPKGFCIAQTLIIGFATFILTGVAGAFSMATSLAVLRPKGWGDNTALKWRNIYLMPVVIFPIAATIVHAVIVVKFNSVKPTDDLHCDSSDPEWARFLSYAGIPFIVSLPCMYFSIKSLMIIWKANKKIQRSNRSLVFESVGNYTSMPPRSLKHGSVSILFKEPDFPPSPTNPTASSPTTANNYNFNSNINNFGYNFQSTSYAPTPVSAMTSITSAPSFVTANEYPPTPKATTPSPAPFLFATAGSQSPASPASPNLLERKFHLPFRPSMTGNAGMDLATESDVKSGNLKDVKSGNLKEEQQQQSEEDIEDDISSTLPEFRTPMPIPLSQRRAGKEKIEGSHSVRDHSGGGESDVSEVVWSRSKMDSNDYGAMEGRRPTSGIGVDARQRSRVDLKDDDSDVLGSGDVTSGRYMTPMEFISQPSEGSAARSSPNLAPAIWRIILFQTAFCAVQILVCISTIVDLATHRPTPTPLGTQHFALLLAAWGPAVVFGHSPAVRKSLKFW